MFCNREIGVKSLVYLLHNSYFGVDNWSIWPGGGTAGVETTTLILPSIGNGMRTAHAAHVFQNRSHTLQELSATFVLDHRFFCETRGDETPHECTRGAVSQLDAVARGAHK